MTGSITVGGMASGPGGILQFGPSTVSGSKTTPELVNVELEAGVAKKIPVPPEAVKWAVFFQFAGEPGEVKLTTNLNAGDAGYPLAAQGDATAFLFTGVKELIFKATVAPKVFQVAFI